MRRGKDASLKALISAMAEAESKSYYEEQENALNDLSGLLKTFLNRDDSPERVRIRKDYEAGAALTGKGGIRQRLGAVDMEFFGRAYFPHYFSRPSPEFHRELDAIWQDGVLKGLTPSTPKLVKQISRMNGCKRVVAAPRGHAKSTSLTFKGTIHAVVYGYKHYPIIISDSSDQAEGFLDNIRVEFEENEAIREDFGDLTGKVWRSNVLVTSTNIKVEAIGSGKKIRGRKHRNWRPDLLILDDLGTEFVTPYFITVFYSLLNNRLGAGLPTIITTNITDGALLEKRYTEKISSRLSAFIPFRFLGEDIRPQKAAE